MMNIVADLIKGNVDIDEKMIAVSMLASAKEAADMYLNSTLTSTTPGLRAIYSASLGQIVEGHTALTELSVNKGWLKPYESLDQQLSCSHNKSKTAIEEQ